MIPAEVWPWAAILMLGVWHGVNPGMGWLFAVALGMQEGDGRAVVAALGPLALGHGIAIAVAALVALAIGTALPLHLVKWGVAVLLFGLGVQRLLSHKHPRYGGMRVTGAQLSIWSLLMASAHGAGMMVIPFVLRATHGSADGVALAHAHGSHGGHTLLAGTGEAAADGGATALAALTDSTVAALAATLVHTAGYLAITAAIAWVVYSKVGLRMLRRLWVNLDLVWGWALILTAVATPLM